MKRAEREAQWAKHIEGWKKSGLTQSGYCGRESISSAFAGVTAAIETIATNPALHMRPGSHVPMSGGNLAGPHVDADPSPSLPCGLT